MKALGVLKKLIPYVIISAILVAAGFYVYGKSQEYNDIYYSTYNVNEQGCKALYLLTDKMGYNVQRHEKSAAFLPQNTTMVVIEPNSSYFNKLELKLLKQWLAEGNTMILVGNGEVISSYFSELKQNPSSTNHEAISATYYKQAEGNLIFVDNNDQFINASLKNHKPVVGFIQLLMQAGNDNVSFNEYYHGIGIGKTGAFDIMSLTMKLAVLQLIIAVVLVLLSQSKRFGVPLVLNEAIKRQENEKVFALSNIFIKARANSAALEIYMERFYRELKKYLGLPRDAEIDELIRAAESDAMLSKHDTAAIIKQGEAYISRRGKNSKELVVIIHKLDEIRRVMR